MSQLQKLKVGQLVGAVICVAGIPVTYIESLNGFWIGKDKPYVGFGIVIFGLVLATVFRSIAWLKNESDT